VWGNLSLSELLRRHTDDLLGYGLATTKNFLGNRGGRDRLVCVMDIINVRNVRDISDVRNVTNIGDVDYAQVVASIVIPREERLSGAERKPTYQADANAD
jgi:hypothetical protein